MSQVPTVLGTPITVTVTEGKVRLNDSNVVATDVEASNGVIHVVDTVILPTAKKTADASTKN
jgi:uncharacterized surface protein with fasciclin (FAS1) repeats